MGDRQFRTELGDKLVDILEQCKLVKALFRTNRQEEAFEVVLDEVLQNN